MDYRLQGCDNPFYKYPKASQVVPRSVLLMNNAHFIAPPVPFGKITIQRIRSGNYRIWRFDLKIKEKCEVVIRPYIIAFSLHIMLKNEIELPFEQNAILREGEMNLLYMRNITYDIVFNPGIYSFIQIDYSMQVLNVIQEHDDLLGKSLFYAENTLGCVLNKEPVTINLIDKFLLNKIIKGGYSLDNISTKAVAYELLADFLSQSTLHSLRKAEY